MERDLPGLGIRIAAVALRRFWTMLAHGHGNIWNRSEFARSFGVADSTVRHYLDLLVTRGGTRRGFEIKRSSSPRVTPSMRSALADLKLDSLDVVHAGGQSIDLASASGPSHCRDC